MLFRDSQPCKARLSPRNLEALLSGDIRAANPFYHLNDGRATIAFADAARANIAASVNCLT